jgi:hypothetical protein
MSKHTQHQFREAQEKNTEIEANPLLFFHYQTDREEGLDGGIEDEKSSSEILRIYLKHLSHTYRKKQRRCISEELG